MATVSFLLLFFLCCSSSIAATATAPRYTAIFSFGDSLADTGNFLIAGKMPFHTIAHLPFGVTYFGHPTGRCSDGRLIVDFIAEAFGLPLLPPYLKPNQSFSRGVNFAFAGATALDVGFFGKRDMGAFLWSNNSLGVQLQWFEQLKPSLCQTPTACKELFGKSLFLVGEIGGNDYNYAFFSGKKMKVLRSYVPIVVGEIVSVTEKLIGEGATELIVPGNLPIGCSALYLTLFPSDRKEDYDGRNGCLKEFNRFARHHNAVLQTQLEKLRNKNPQVKIIYADYYGAAIRFALAPRQYGFRGGLKACCGGGGPYNFNVTSICGRPGSTMCHQPLEYANWDGIHLTEAAYHSIAVSLLKGSFTSPPFAA